MMPSEETASASIFPESGATSVLYSADDDKKRTLLVAGAIGIGALVIFMFMQKQKQAQF